MERNGPESLEQIRPGRQRQICTVLKDADLRAEHRQTELPVECRRSLLLHMLEAAEAADRGQLRTAYRLLKSPKLFRATETTAPATAQMCQTDESAQMRTDFAFQSHEAAPRCDVRPQHVRSQIRDLKDKRVLYRVVSETATFKLC